MIEDYTFFSRECAIPFIFLVTLLFSCSKNQTYENLEPKPAKNESIEIEIEDFEIKIDSLTYPSYSVFQNVWLSDSSYLLGLNRRMNSIDVFNLTSRQLSKHIHIDRKGPDGFDQIGGFYMYNWDSIFLFNYIKLALLDSSGTITAKWDLLESGVQDFEGNASLGTDLGFDLYYSKQRNSVFLKNVPRNVAFTSKEFYTKPFIAELDLDNLHLETIPFEYSAYLKENYVAEMDMPFLSFFGNQIICCFTGESNIYSFNLDNEHTEVYGGQSGYSMSMASPLSRSASREEKDKHRVESVSYFNVRNDPFRDLYYRLHFGDIKQKDFGDVNETYRHKGLYLMIFNSDMELIREIELEKYVYLPEFYGVTKDGIVLSANHDMNMDYEGKYSKFRLLRMTYIEQRGK